MRIRFDGALDLRKYGILRLLMNLNFKMIVTIQGRSQIFVIKNGLQVIYILGPTLKLFLSVICLFIFWNVSIVRILVHIWGMISRTTVVLSFGCKIGLIWQINFSDNFLRIWGMSVQAP